MGRRPCCDGIGLNKGAWSTEEDRKLINFIQTQKQCSWRDVPEHAGLLRCGKSCRLRWTNYLRPDLKRGLLSEVEEKLVIELHSQLGNRWSQIASQMPGRTDNEIKNLWHTHIKKKLKKMGIDPVTHQPLALESNHHHHKQKEGISSLESTISNDDQSGKEQEETGPNIHDQQGTSQEKDGALSEELTITNDFMAKETMEMETDNGFSIDEVPLIKPHELLVHVSDQPTLAESSMPTIESVLEDVKCLPMFEDWTTENLPKNHDIEISTGFPYDHDFSDWDSLVKDLDIIIGESPPEITTSTGMNEWSDMENDASASSINL